MKDGVRSRLESDGGQAIRLLNEQLTELETVRGLNPRDHKFKAWRVQTRSYLAPRLSAPQDSDAMRGLREGESYRIALPFQAAKKSVFLWRTAALAARAQWRLLARQMDGAVVVVGLGWILVSSGSQCRAY
jgi:hypothetical protein